MIRIALCDDGKHMSDHMVMVSDYLVRPVEEKPSEKTMERCFDFPELSCSI